MLVHPVQKARGSQSQYGRFRSGLN